MTNPNHRLTVKTVAGLFLAAVLVANSAYSQSADPTRSRPNAVDRLERAMNGLDLSEAQKVQLQTLTENHRQSTAGLRDQARAAQQTIATTPRTDPSYATIVAEARRSLETARNQLRAQQDQLQTDARALLTTEQLNTLETRRAERAKKFAERRAGHSEQRPRRSERSPGGGERLLWVGAG